MVNLPGGTPAASNLIIHGQLKWMPVIVTGGGSAVHCIRCETRLAQLPVNIDLSDQKLEVGELGGLVCDRCGAVLPTQDPTDVMLGKLSQLSRFGLGADDRPLFLPEGEEQ